MKTLRALTLTIIAAVTVACLVVLLHDGPATGATPAPQTISRAFWANPQTAFPPLTFPTNSPAFASVDLNGNLRVITLPLARTTYSAARGSIGSPGGSLFFSMCGNVSTVVRVQYFYVGVNGSTIVPLQISLNKTSTATSGGTAVPLTSTPHDSVNAVAGSTANAYTVAPTAGTLVGLIDVQQLASSASTTAAAGNTAVFDYRRSEGQAIVLRGAGQCIEASASAFPTAPVLTYSIIWTEDTLSS